MNPQNGTRLKNAWYRVSPYFLIPTLLLSACGKSSYDPVTTVNQGDAPGTYTVPAKIDILLAVDDTGSAMNAQIARTAVEFMNRLNEQGWDYRVAVTGLTRPNTITQVAVSKYDALYNSRGQYKAPYPGAPAIRSTLAVFPEQISLPGAAATNGDEPGIRTVAEVLEEEAFYLTGNRFLREDAMTAIVILSTSEDTSEGAVKSPSPIPLGSDLVDRIKTAKGYGAANGVKVYSLVNATAQPSSNYNQLTSCLGRGSSLSGNRYMQLAQQTLGKYFDICSMGVGEVFRAVNTQLTALRESYISEYVFVDSVPDLSTVKMVKILENGTRVDIPSASSNNSTSTTGGWTYVEGNAASYPSISYPIKMNYRTGYVFKLSGSYILKGKERAEVTYRVRGLQNSQ